MCLSINLANDANASGSQGGFANELQVCISEGHDATSGAEMNPGQKTVWTARLALVLGLLLLFAPAAASATSDFADMACPSSSSCIAVGGSDVSGRVRCRPQRGMARCGPGRPLRCRTGPASALSRALLAPGQAPASRLGALPMA